MFPAALWESKCDEKKKSKQLPGRGIKWNCIEEVPFSEYEAERRYNIRDKLQSTPITKRLDAVTHGKIVFFSRNKMQVDMSSNSCPLISTAASTLSYSSTPQISPFCLSTSEHACSAHCTKCSSEKTAVASVLPASAITMVSSVQSPAFADFPSEAILHICLEHNGITRGLDTMWKHVGIETNIGHCLYPEEALFLMQAGEFRALCPRGRVISLHHLLIASGVSYTALRLYSRLCGAALRPVRHQPHVGVTSYERKIKLDQHNKFKSRKKKSPSHTKSCCSSEMNCQCLIDSDAHNTVSSYGTYDLNRESDSCCINQLIMETTTKNVASDVAKSTDLDMEMMEFYSSIECDEVRVNRDVEEEAVVQENDYISNNSKMDDIEDNGEMSEEAYVEYEESKRLILEDLPSMNARTGECKISWDKNFLPRSFKVLHKDYIVWAEDIYCYNKYNLRHLNESRRSDHDWRSSSDMGGISSTPMAGVSDSYGSNTPEILDSDTETSSSSDSESVSSLSDSEDVSYQGWYVDWNNPIYMKRVITSDPDSCLVKRDICSDTDCDDKEIECERDIRSVTCLTNAASLVSNVHHQTQNFCTSNSGSYTQHFDAGVISPTAQISVEHFVNYLNNQSVNSLAPSSAIKEDCKGEAKKYHGYLESVVNNKINAFNKLNHSQITERPPQHNFPVNTLVMQSESSHSLLLRSVETDTPAVESAVQQAPVSPAVESAVQQAPVSPAVESAVQQAPVSPAVESAVQQAPVSPAVESAVQQAPVSPAVESAVQQAPVSPAVESAVQQAPVSPAVESAVQQAPVSPAVESAVQQAPVSPAVESAVQQAPVSPAVESAVQQAPVSPAVESAVQQAPVSPAVESAVQQAPVSPAVESAVQQAPVSPAVESAVQQAPVSPAVESAVQQAPVSEGTVAPTSLQGNVPIEDEDSSDSLSSSDSDTSTGSDTISDSDSNNSCGKLDESARYDCAAGSHQNGLLYKMERTDEVKQEPSKKVSWENPVDDFLSILGDTLKEDVCNNFELLARECSSPEMEEHCQFKDFKDETPNEASVISIINLIETVKKESSIIDLPNENTDTSIIVEEHSPIKKLVCLPVEKLLSDEGSSLHKTLDASCQGLDNFLNASQSKLIGTPFPTFCNLYKNRTTDSVRAPVPELVDDTDLRASLTKRHKRGRSDSPPLRSHGQDTVLMATALDKRRRATPPRAVQGRNVCSGPLGELRVNITSKKSSNNGLMSNSDNTEERGIDRLPQIAVTFMPEWGRGHTDEQMGGTAEGPSVVIQRTVANYSPNNAYSSRSQDIREQLNYYSSSRNIGGRNLQCDNLPVVKDIILEDVGAHHNNYRRGCTTGTLSCRVSRRVQVGMNGSRGGCYNSDSFSADLEYGDNEKRNVIGDERECFRRGRRSRVNGRGYVSHDQTKWYKFSDYGDYIDNFTEGCAGNVSRDFHRDHSSLPSSCNAGQPENFSGSRLELFHLYNDCGNLPCDLPQRDGMMSLPWSQERPGASFMVPGREEARGRRLARGGGSAQGRWVEHDGRPARGGGATREGGRTAYSGASHGKTRGNARQQQWQHKSNYWHAMRAQQSVLDQHLVHHVHSWRQYKAALSARDRQASQRRPCVMVITKGAVKPLIAEPERGKAPHTLASVMAKLRSASGSSAASSATNGGNSTSLGTSGDSTTDNTSGSNSSGATGGGTDRVSESLSEWVQREVPQSAHLYTPVHLPKVVLDVYTSQSGYCRSNPVIPDYRVVLPRADGFLNPCQLLALRRHHADAATLALATGAATGGRLRHVALPHVAGDATLRPHALTWSRRLYERR